MDRRRAANGRKLTTVVLATLVAAALSGCADARQPTAHASWNGFGPDRWPGADWRPYDARSPFNQPIPARVRVHPRSQRMIAQVLAWGPPSTIVAGSHDSSDDYGHPTFWARTRDPVYRLRPYEDHDAAPPKGTRIRIPDAARPAGGTDGHMTVVQPDGWEYDFWQVRERRPGGGVLRYSIGGRLRVDGLGLREGTTAAGFGNLAGIVRAPELAAGRIDHALFVVLRCASRSNAFGFGVRRPRDRSDSAYVHPANGGGARCGPEEADAPPLGARLQLAMSAQEIDALDAPAWKKAILRALARYGGYVGDTGGPGFAVQIESSTTYTAYERPDPLLALAQRSARAGDELVQPYGNRYVFDVARDVDWARHLRVVAPPPR